MKILENRIPPPVVATLIAALMWLLSRHVPGVDLAGPVRMLAALVVAASGLVVCLAGVVSFRRAKTTVNPLKPETASSLVVSGIYRYTRNPMYVGFAVCLAGWAVYLASPVALLGVAGFVLYINRFQIAPEERALAALFGEAFTAYRARVRRWL